MDVIKKQYNKIFSIGFNKTGTTSVEALLRELGFLLPNQQEQEITLVKELHKGNLASLTEFCSNYDAFQDLPFAQGQTYVQADALFPDSKFILTVRDSQAWFDSLVRFHLKGILKRAGVTRIEDANEGTFKDQNNYLYTNYSYENFKRQIAIVEDNKIKFDWSLLYDKSYYIRMYEQRNMEIIKYFQGRENDLLVIDIEKERDTGRLLRFLDIKGVSASPYPHLNQSK